MATVQEKRTVQPDRPEPTQNPARSGAWTSVAPHTSRSNRHVAGRKHAAKLAKAALTAPLHPKLSGVWQKPFLRTLDYWDPPPMPFHWTGRSSARQYSRVSFVLALL